MSLHSHSASWRAWGFIAFPLAVIGVFIAIPTLLGIGLSLFAWDGGGAPTFIGMENYRSAFAGDAQLWRSLRNTLIFTFASVPLSVGLGFLIAVAIHARWFMGKTAARTMFFLPTVMSIVAVGFTWQWMLNPRAGIVNLLPWVTASNSPDLLGDTPLGLATLVFVQVWRTVGFCVVLYVAALSRVPRSLYEAAAVDGASSWQMTRHVTWPAVRPMTAFLAITGAIWALQVFDLDVVMNGWNPQRWNDMINTQIFREFKSGRLGYAATVGVVVLALTAVVAAAQFRWFRRKAATA